MNKRMRLLFAALFIIVIILAAAITRLYSDSDKNVYDGSAKSSIAQKIEGDENGNWLFLGNTGSYGIADSSDRVIVSPEWDNITFTDSGLCIAQKHIRGKILSGCIDYEGNVVIPFIYSSIEPDTVNGCTLYFAEAEADDSIVIYNSSFVPCFSRSWKSCEISGNELLLTAEKGCYRYSVNPTGITFKNAAISGNILDSEYKIDVTSKLLLSKLSVSMIEDMASAAEKYIEYAFTDNADVLADIRQAENAVFLPLFPDDPQLDSKKLSGISDIFLYSTRSEDDTPHFAVAVTADTKLAYTDKNGEPASMNEKYKAVIEFSGSSAGDLKTVSGAFTVSSPEYPEPEPEHPSIGEIVMPTTSAAVTDEIITTTSALSGQE